jgi:hypothetical protein
LFAWGWRFIASPSSKATGEVRSAQNGIRTTKRLDPQHWTVETNHRSDVISDGLHVDRTNPTMFALPSDQIGSNAIPTDGAKDFRIQEVISDHCIAVDALIQRAQQEMGPRAQHCVGHA